ncbi:hypothetical protein F2P81_025123 [Scophthalmus maximus]|uniref:Fibrinogen C-terminal domain-containing protein n=1 Tax=Scophthalmus maximus TaxID=52904 RepID=A0A6A4RQF4_SCOMX|nr:hypothetical protein F2P81_025123 [Scophthalmus maximus]
MSDAVNVGVNLDAFSHAINGIQALRSSVSRVFESLKDGMKNRETLEGREKQFISEFQDHLQAVNRDLTYVDDVISRIGRMFPDMTIELFRPNGTSAVLLVTLGKVLKAIVVMRSLFIDRTIVRGFNENVYNEDGKLDIWTKSQYQVFQKVTDHATTALLHYQLPQMPDVVVRSFMDFSSSLFEVVFVWNRRTDRMMLNDRWTIMNNSSSELDSKRPNKHKKCCSFLLWFAVVLVVIAAVVTVTVTILYLNQYPLPFISRGGVSSSPVISTNPRESGALVTVSRVTAGEPISIFLDPNCPDHSEIFLRWEELQSSLLRALTNHNTGDWQERGLVQRLGEELKVLSGHAHNMRVEADSLKRGQGVLDQRLDELQREQSRTLQLQSDAHSAVLKLAAGFSDSLLGLQRETESLRRLKGELQTHNKNTGLQRMYSLTRSGGVELRIDMADFDNATAFARYADFSVGRDSVNPEEDGYPLTVDQYSGTAGDSLLKHSGMRFTTSDRDHDQSENNCAAYYQGAWWYRNCHTSNLNGQYLRGGHTSYADGVEWSSWTGWQYSLRFTEMKIRPNSKQES